MTNVQVREITGTQYVPLTFHLRFQVWSDEAELTASVRAQALITDEHDEHARHWAAFVDCKMVAAARMCIHELQEETPDAEAFKAMKLRVPIATINRLVVKRQWRKCGIARQFDTQRIEAAREGRAACVVGTAFDWRVASLQRYGFTPTEYRWTMPYLESLTARAMVLIL